MNRRNEEQMEEMRFIDRLRHFTYELSVYIQYFIAFSIIIAIIVTLLSLPIQISRLTDVDSESLIGFLKYTINILIAIELIRVLCNQTLDTIVEILLIAITRELIIEHMTTWEMLFGIVAVGVLFLIRKYLFVSQLDKEIRTELHPRMKKSRDKKGRTYSEASAPAKAMPEAGLTAQDRAVSGTGTPDKAKASPEAENDIR